MTSLETHMQDGYGWCMDDSARLRAEVERRAELRVPRRVPVQDVIRTMATNEATRRGIDPAEFFNRINDPARGDQLLAEAEQRIHRERLARQADILLRRLPHQYRDADFPHTEFGREARAWLEEYRAWQRSRSGNTPPPSARRAAGALPDAPRSLVILGETGTGKTWTACAIARALLVEDTIPVTLVTVAEMLAELRPAVGGLDVDMAQFALAPVLILDDLGMERPTEWVAEQLYRLAHERSHNGRPTIITSNLTGAQIKERYDVRTVQRLFGGARLIQIAGESRREMPF
jgi:DNA replication protein DnaC